MIYRILHFRSLLTLLVFPVLISNAQNSLTFKNLRDMELGRFGIGYTTDGTNIYAVNGSSFTPFFTKDIEKYDMSTKNWIKITNDLVPKRYASAEYLSNKIYVINGYGATGINDKVEVYDLNTNTVTLSTPNPYPAYYSGSVVWNGKVYVFGGTIDGNKYSNRLYEFDPETSLWKRLADMPEHKQTRGEIVGGMLYTVSGYSDSLSNKIHSYDFSKDKWTYIGEVPEGQSAYAITKYGEFIFLLGDYTKQNKITAFNTNTGQLLNIKSNMIGRKHCGAEIIGNKLYVFAGTKAAIGSFLANTQVAEIGILESNIIDTAICIGTEITIPFTLTGNITGMNKFTCQLSDSTGDFTKYKMLGTVAGTSSASFTASIPESTLPGNGYKIRVVATNPSVLSFECLQEIKMEVCSKKKKKSKKKK